MIGVTVLGSTGSIGVSTLDVLRRHPDQFRIIALAANNSVEKLLQQVIEFQPQYAVLVDPPAAEQLRKRITQQGLTTGTTRPLGRRGRQDRVSLRCSLAHARRRFSLR